MYLAPESFAEKSRRKVASLMRFVDRVIEGRSCLAGADEAGNAPLMIAAYQGDAQSVERLLAMGANIEASNDWGDTALGTGAMALSNSEKIAAMLIGAGCDIDARNDAAVTALMRVARSSRMCEARILLEAGFSVELKDKKGRDALGSALANGCKSFADMIGAYAQRGELENKVSAAGSSTKANRL